MGSIGSTAGGIGNGTTFLTAGSSSKKLTFKFDAINLKTGKVVKGMTVKASTITEANTKIRAEGYSVRVLLQGDIYDRTQKRKRKIK